MAVSPRVFLALAWGAALAGQAPPDSAAAPAVPEILAAHNTVREKMHLPPLRWSDQLAAWARDWAYELILSDEFAHRTRNPYGENLYEIRNGVATPARVVSAWSVEATGYDYLANRCHSMCGHYTQLVWRDTRAVGCAVVHDSHRQVWVCNYDPPGNVAGQRPY
jgi:uncharacterized protein YkwD